MWTVHRGGEVRTRIISNELSVVRTYSAYLFMSDDDDDDLWQVITFQEGHN
jgi:hypothetical protein